MSVARIAVLILAVLAAAAAAWLASSFVGTDVQQVQAPEPQIVTDEVLVAARDLQVGAKVTPGDMRWQTWPTEALASGYVVKNQTPDAMIAMQGALVRSAMMQGEPITNGKVIDTTSAGFMAARLGKGMRAVSVAISPETGAGGFILPGDRVDVIVTHESRNDTGRDSIVVSDTVLANVRVLAIDQAFGETNDDTGEKIAVGKTATLELTPKQAETLARSQAMGDLWLSLRSLEDTATGGPVDTGVLGKNRNTQARRGSAVTVVRYGVQSLELPRTGQ
ncbi:Flp pilus assembly protein RcpC/CpaB [Candidatus Phaeomarinobacter ectocarpi]|uniref:Flp pilus assembly protein RcpC/CpaB n=1 Tax=Candidatus Phaeomarinibacter ectocarpi TaxID=1458461 RepID=X5MN96_9HYPH|nr:Flp pilus assembly protein CpaB [Candidatus Phaeomarinobacter ectocarpi]CDO59911.1 Flp pilus assembly protein RcpC/CpaB [Candidatus Phaeomarinobacter ectocarpi]